MSKSSDVFSVTIGVANTEGGSPNSKMLPDPDNDPAGAVSFAGFATTSGAIDSFSFEENSHSQEGSRSTPGAQALAPVAVRNTTGASLYGVPNGSYLRVGYPDGIELSSRFRGCNGANPGLEGWGKILGSSMGLFEPQGAAANIACSVAGAADGSTFIVDSNDFAGVGWHVGCPVRVRASGAVVDEYAIITHVSDDGTDATCKVYPSFTFQQGAGAEINACYAFYPVIGKDNAKFKDHHLRFSMGAVGSSASVQTLAVGNRCSGFEIADDSGIAILTTTSKPLAVVSEDDKAGKAGVVSAPESAGSPMQHRYGARVDMGVNHKALSAPVSGARAYLPNFNHSVSVTFNTGEGTPETRSVLRGTTHEVHNATCTVTIETEKNSTFQNMLVNDERRSIFLGYGPAGSGHGSCFAILNAGREDGSSSPTAGDQSRIQQSTTLRALEDQNLCDETGLTEAQKRISSAPFMLILPKA